MSDYYYPHDPQSESSDTKGAVAMRRYRARQKKGTRCFTIYASVHFLDALVQEGFLPEPKTPKDINEKAVNEAVYRLLNAWRHRDR
jgi:hypothetical protein